MHLFYVIAFLISPLRFKCSEEDEARNYLKYFNTKLAEINNKCYLAEWNYTTNLTDANLKTYLKATEILARETKLQYKHLMKFHWQNYSDPLLKRQFKLFFNLKELALPEEKYQKLTHLISIMQEVYAKAKVCSFSNKSKCNLELEPNLAKLMATSRDADELKYIWTIWRKVVGSNLKSYYIQYVELMNEAAKCNGFKDASQMALDVYEIPDIKDQIYQLWKQIKPAYLQLHAYVRYRLRQFYGDIVSERGPIPAHLLGNMWAQSWNAIENLTLPYPRRKRPNVSAKLIKCGYTPLSIFKTAEDFFISINMSSMPEMFWKNSLLEKPADREVVCHASAWDFGDGKDFRIKQCTRIDEDSFVTAHHEMGHVEYYLQYKNLPSVFQSGANPAFHEAVGDTIALSVATLEHYRKLGFIEDYIGKSEARVRQRLNILREKSEDTFNKDILKHDISNPEFEYELSKKAAEILKKNYKLNIPYQNSKQKSLKPESESISKKHVVNAIKHNNKENSKKSPEDVLNEYYEDIFKSGKNMKEHGDEAILKQGSEDIFKQESKDVVDQNSKAILKQSTGDILDDDYEEYIEQNSAFQHLPVDISEIDPQNNFNKHPGSSLKQNSEDALNYLHKDIFKKPSKNIVKHQFKKTDQQYFKSTDKRYVENTDKHYNKNKEKQHFKNINGQFSNISKSTSKQHSMTTVKHSKDADTLNQYSRETLKQDTLKKQPENVLKQQLRGKFKKHSKSTSKQHPEDILNHLFVNALSKIPFMPFGLVVDLWRWRVFSGKTKPNDYNCHWWELVNEYQGIEPPVKRSELDFDPASKYHVVANYDYIAYFLSHILQYQFHKALCIKAGKYDKNDPERPLHGCDIYGSKEAGEAFKKMLSLGSSKPWPDALYVLTGYKKIDAGPFLEYFMPLIKWLEGENKKNGIFVGWDRSDKICCK